MSGLELGPLWPDYSSAAGELVEVMAGIIDNDLLLCHLGRGSGSRLCEFPHSTGLCSGSPACQRLRWGLGYEKKKQQGTLVQRGEVILDSSAMKRSILFVFFFSSAFFFLFVKKLIQLTFLAEWKLVICRSWFSPCSVTYQQ